MPDAAATDIALAQQACIEAGLTPVSSFDENTLAGRALKSNYEDIVQARLSTETRWNFATGHTGATYQTSAPAAEWASSFQISTDPQVLLVETVLSDGYPIPYDIFEDHVYCDATSENVVKVKGIIRPDVAKWPAFFRLAMKFEIAAMLARVVVRKADIIEQLEARAAIEMAKARTADSQQVSPARIRTDRMHAVRSGARSGV